MKRGFTLIELLVVIAIIGILATIVLVSMTGVQQSGRDTARKADMRQIVSAQQMYYAANEEYASSATYPNAIGSYMLQTPKDPSTDGPYGWIDNQADTQLFCVFATLEDDTGCANTKYYTSTQAGTFEVCLAAAPASNADCLP